MTDYSRRDFLKLAGTGTAAAAVVSSGVLATLHIVDSQTKGDIYSFRAVTGLPQQPLPAYASYVLQGNVDIAQGTGTLTRTVFAGAPDAMSTVVFDELTREMRIAGARRDSAGVLTLRAILGGAADLHPGEARTATIVVDPSKATVQAPFVGNDVVMQLQP